MNNDDLYTLVREPISVLRKKFIIICDNDYCAAFLLDIFVAQVAKAGDSWEDRIPPYVITTIDELTDRLFDLFDIETVQTSLDYLVEKKYLACSLVTPPHKYKIECHMDQIEQAYIDYDAPTEEKYFRMRAEAYNANIKPIPKSKKLTKAQERATAIEKEKKVILINNKRTLKANLPSTLTHEQWINTLDQFKWKCAYCRKTKYEVLEHFIPINHGGGTEQTNCVPSCARCNAMKQAWNPLSVYRPPLPQLQGGFTRVHAYFQSLRNRE